MIITETALTNLERGLNFMRKKHPEYLCLEVGETVIHSTYQLAANPNVGQLEPILDELELGHRRIIVGHFKIIYRVVQEQGNNLVTDIFDSRQIPSKMNP